MSESDVVRAGFQLEFEKLEKDSEGSLENADLEGQCLQETSEHLHMGTDW